MSDYVVRLVSTTGAVIAELENAVPGNVSWELNQAGSADFTLPFDDAKTKGAAVLSNEVQIWRNGSLLWWGVPLRRSIAKAGVSYQCAGLLWYFKKRFVGRARTNRLSNPSFESGSLAGWFSNTGQTSTAVQERRMLGDWQCKMTNGAADQDVSLQQNFSHTAGGFGDNIFLSAWYLIPSAGYLGPPKYNRGLFFQRQTAGGTPIEERHVPFDDSTPKDQWQRAEIMIWVPPGATETLNCRLYCPGGTIYWDACQATLMESLSFYGGYDQVSIAQGLIQHAQDPSFNKNDLHVGVGGAASGIVRDRAYQWADHENIFEKISEFPSLSGGFDFDIEYTPTTRTFKTYYPQRGSLKSGLKLELDRNVADFSIDEDGESVANSVIAFDSQVQGPGREEAYYADTSGLGGLVLEDVLASEGSIDLLDELALGTVNARKNVIAMPQLTTMEGSDPMIGQVLPGDTVPATVAYNGVTWLNGTFRIVKVDLDCAQDKMRLTVNA